jgi:hypothetical protein
MPLCALAIIFSTSCEGPVGPAGADGTAGVDGNAVCLECHNLTKKNEVNSQYITSGHAEGSTVGYAGGRSGCAMCHSDQGFIETQFTGQDTTAANIPLPQEIQCRTCHAFHQSLDFKNEPNSALRTIDPVDLLMYRAEDPTAPAVSIDLGKESNICANCHQPRHLGPDLMPDSTAVTSTRFAAHHGTQATSFAGLGAAEIGMGYPAPGTGGKHVTDASCTTCHMHGADHSWEPSLEACNTIDCHNGSLTQIEDNTRQLAFKALMLTLENKLKAAGLLDATGSPVRGTYPTDQVAAMYNYGWILDDKSNGIHNFAYLETLVNNSIAVFP